ncbi:MAG: hypothetical protein Q3M24_19965 [Candidatus Electrothrix aestuarii]|uniref:Uncharacterized protein n=1 Tax=Candidatus Electrothrix aestuarii TaxID=3062594 RepID=A0AAU8LUJ0_9BACT|nr:hypothetical protein [Candidatus Electrothrix aestuarii]WPD20981.1 MAG: hypothetical protein SD837_12305 [Candidatus Electrothrix sp. GW3-3]
MKVISISELYLMSESVEAVKKMFYKIVNSYKETERPLIIIKGSVQATTDSKDSEQVKVALGILEEHKFGFIRITGSLFDNFSLFVCPD